MQITLSHSGNRLLVRGARIPPELRPFGRRPKVFPICEDVVQRLEEYNDGEVEVDHAVEQLLLEQLKRRSNTAHARHSWGDDWAKVDPRLDSYQEDTVWWLLQQQRCILAESQGLGKTVSALVAARESGAGRVVIVCGTSKREDWARHAYEWAERRAQVVETGDELPDHDCLVMNYEALKRHAGSIEADLLIVDEAHNFRNRKTGLFKALKLAAGKVDLLYLLTASPIVNGADDVWPLLHACDPNRFSSYWSFTFRFLEVVKGYFGIKVGSLIADEEEAFWRLLGGYMLQRDKDVIADRLPEIRRRRLDCPLFDTQQALYDQMDQKSRLELNGETVLEATEKIAQITRLRQLVLHPRTVLPDYPYDGGAKVERVVDLVREYAGRQIVVFSQFSTIVDILAIRLGVEGFTFSRVTGGVTGDDREDELRRFRDGETQVMLVTHGTGGEGLNDLVVASVMIFVDLAWHPAGNQQARDRINRRGQRADVIDVVYLHAPDTIDDHILAILNEKNPVTIDQIAQRMR